MLLLALQVTTTAFLWTLDALNQISEGTFALFLAVDLVSFAIVSYIYRSQREFSLPNRGWIFVGCALILILLFSSLVLV